MIRKILVLILFLFSMNLQAQQNPPKVLAILPLKTVGGGNAESIGTSVQGAILSALQKSGVFKIVDKTALDKVLNELQFSGSDLADSQNSVKLGKLLAAEYLLNLSVTHDNGVYLIFTSLIQVSTGKVVQTVQPVLIKKIEETVSLGQTLANRLLNLEKDSESSEHYYGTWIVTKTSPDVLKKELKYKKIILNEDDTYEIHLINNADNFVIFKGRFVLDGHQIDFYHQDLFINGQPSVNPSGQKLQGTLYLVNGLLYFTLTSMTKEGPDRPDAMEIQYRNIAKRK